MSASFDEYLSANNFIASQRGAGSRHDGMGNEVDAARGGLNVDESSWSADLANPNLLQGPGGGAPPTLYSQFAEDEEANAVDYSSGSVKSLDKYDVNPQVVGPVDPRGQFSIQPNDPLGGTPTLDTMVKSPPPSKTAYGIPPNYSGLQGGHKYWQNPDGSLSDKGQFDAAAPAAAAPVGQRQQPNSYMSPVVTREANEIMIEPDSVRGLPGYGEIKAADFKPTDGSAYDAPSLRNPAKRNREEEMWKSGRVAWGDDNGDVSYIDNTAEGNWGKRLEEMPDDGEANPYSEFPAASQKLISDAGMQAQQQAAVNQGMLATANAEYTAAIERGKAAQAQLESLEANASQMRAMKDFLGQSTTSPTGEYMFDAGRAARIKSGELNSMDPARDATDPNKIAEIVRKYDSDLERLRAEVRQWNGIARDRKGGIDAISSRPVVDPYAAMDQAAQVERERLDALGAEQATAASEKTEAANLADLQRHGATLARSIENHEFKGIDEKRAKAELAEVNREIIALSDPTGQSFVFNRPLPVDKNPTPMQTPAPQPLKAAKRVKSQGNAGGGGLTTRKAQIPAVDIGEFNDLVSRYMKKEGVSQQEAENVILEAAGL